MKKLTLILLCLPMIFFGQVSLLSSIGLNSEPLGSDSICTIIPRTQGNPWTPINIGDTMADFTSEPIWPHGRTCMSPLKMVHC